MNKKLIYISIYVIISTLIGVFLVYSTRPVAFITFTLCYLLTLLVIFYSFKWLELNAKNLLKQPLFISSVLVPLQMFLLYGLWAWKGHSIDFTSKGFSTFLDISKLPLLILASSVPLAAIINNIHRTIQTENQIEKTQDQINLVIEKNKTDSYYSHLKSYSDIFQTLPKFKILRLNIKDDCFEETELSIVHPYGLYKNIFPLSSIKNGYNTSIEQSFLEKLQKKYMNINQRLNAARKAEKNHDVKLFSLGLLESDIIELCRLLGVDYKYQEHIFDIMLERPTRKREVISVSFTDEKQIKQILWGLRIILIELYVLIDQDPTVFQKGKDSGDYLPDYALYEEKLFDGVLPINNDRRV